MTTAPQTSTVIPPLTTAIVRQTSVCAIPVIKSAAT
jgi:hypothetical protein